MENLASSSEDEDDGNELTSSTSTSTTTTTMATTAPNVFEKMMARPPPLTPAEKILKSYTTSLDLPKTELNAVYATAAALATDDIKLPKIRGLKKAEKIGNLLVFYKAMCKAEGKSVMDAPYFKHEAAANQRKRRSQQQAELENKSSSSSSSSSSNTLNFQPREKQPRRTASTTTARTGVDPYHVMRGLTEQYKRKNCLCIRRYENKVYIYCLACDQIICEPCKLETHSVKMHCGEGSVCTNKTTIGVAHKANLIKTKLRNQHHVKQIELYKRVVPNKHTPQDENEIQFRYDMTMGFLMASTPFSHADVLKRPVSKHAFFKMPGDDVLSRVKPAVTAFEKWLISSELGTDVPLSEVDKEDLRQSPLVNCIFDGTERGGDNQAIIFRFIVRSEDSVKVVQRVVEIKNAKKAVSGATLAGMIRDSLIAWGVKPEIALIFTNRDNCSTNGTAINILKQQGDFKNLFDAPCWSHLGNNTGCALFNPPKKCVASANAVIAEEADENEEGVFIDRKFESFPVLQLKMKYYAGTNSSSHAMELFLEMFNVNDVKGLSTVRWFAKADNILQKYNIGYDKILDWADKLVEEGWCDSSAPKLSNLLSNKPLFFQLRVEAVVYVIFSQCIRELTYRLEGDGQLSLVAYSIINELVLKKLKGNWDWLIEDDRFLTVAKEALDYQATQPPTAGLVALNAAKVEYLRVLNIAEKGPLTANGHRLRKKLNLTHLNNLSDAEKKQRQAAHAMAWKKEKDRLDKIAEDAKVVWVENMSKAPPQSLKEYQDLMIKYCSPAKQYFLDHVNSDYASSLKIFKLMAMANGRLAKSKSPSDMNSMIDEIFEILPVLNNWPDKEDWKQKLKDTFPKLKTIHISQYMDDTHRIGDIVDVRYEGYPVPRVAKITAIPSIETTTYSVEYKGRRKHNTADKDEEDGVVPERILRKVDDFLEYYVDVCNIDIKFKVWLELVEIFVLLQPSSAAAERVFSQLAGRFNKQQMALIQDSIWTTIALILHKRTF
jgi:hypothetical protein